MSKGTSAATTAFCATTVQVGGYVLNIDGNGKVTAGNGTLDDPRPNAFSLAHIDDCPGSTPTCRAACYVHGLKAHAPETFALYSANSETIRLILADSEIAAEAAKALAAWISENAAGGFRWHVSGDVFSDEYATWIASVALASPEVVHWIYTRSFPQARLLAHAATVNGGNLVVNLSADRDNYVEARATAREFGFRLCYMTKGDGDIPDDLPENSVIFPDYALRGDANWLGSLPKTYVRMVCPVDYHGKSENRRCGPCHRCMR